MSEEPQGAPRPGRWTGPAAILLAAGIMLAWTWRQWPDPLVDFGIQLYTPWQLAQGKVLYRDVASLYGPLSSYINAGLFWAFGTSFSVLIWANFAWFVVLLGMLYRIGNAVAGRAAATVGCLLVVLLCGFGQYTAGGNYEFMAPYSHEATQGLVLAVGVVYAWMGFARSGRMGCVALAGILTGLAVLTKPEPSLAAAVAAAAGWAALVWGDPRQRARSLPAAGILAGCAAAPVLLATGLFCFAMPPGQALAAALNGWGSAFNPALRNMPAYREWMGTADFGQHLGEMAAAAGWYAVAIAAGLLAAWGMGKLGKRRMGILVGVAVGLGVSLAVVLWPWRMFFFNFGMMRPMPVVLAIAAAGLGTVLWRRRAQATLAERLRWVFVLFAAVYLLRIEFNARVWHFGFVLTVPAMMCLAAGLLVWIPRWLGRYKTLSACGFQGVMLGLLVVTVAAHLHITALQHARKTVLVTGADAGDAFYTDGRGVIINAVVKTLDGRLSESQTMSVFPESVMLNYLARRAAPNRFIHFEPSELAAFGEDNMVAAFEAHPPDAVVLQQADSREFGTRYFGQDYGLKLWGFLMKGYEPMGPPLGAMPFNPDGNFGMELLRRKVSAAESR